MKKNKLVTLYQYDFELYGIVSQIKEYTLAWYFNQIHYFDLIKGDDISIELKDQKMLVVSNYRYETDFIKVHLLRNKLVSRGIQENHWFLPELKQFDYFLKIGNSLEEPSTDDLLAEIRKIEVIDYLLKIDIGAIKLKENLLY